MEPQTVPHSIESEESLIGSLLIAPELLREIRAIIQPEQLFIHRYRWIYQAIINLADKRMSIDVLTISNELGALNQLEEIGGISELTRLMGYVPSALHAESYAQIINGDFVRRQMIEYANNIVKMAYGEQYALDKIQERSWKLLQDVFSGIADNQSGIYAAAAADKQYERMEKIANGADPGIPTGLKDLDYLLNGGARGGDLVLIAGRPGMGKTALMLDFFKYAVSNNNNEKYDVFFSLEMPNEQLTDRLVAKDGINSNNIRRGLLEDIEHPIYTNALDTISKQKFILDDTPGLTPAQLRSKLSKIAAKHPLGNVYVDYIQLMEAGIKSDNRVSEVSYISRQLKLIAREFGIILYAGAQLSRKCEERSNKRPLLADLRESGSLEQDADIVIFVYRPELYYDKPEYQNLAELIVGKHRNGSIGTVSTIFRKNFMRFENADVRTVDLNAEPIKPIDDDKMLREIAI